MVGLAREAFWWNLILREFCDENKIGKAKEAPQGFPGDSVVNNLPASAEDADSISELGRSPRGGNGNPLQDSCLGVPWTDEPGGLQSMGSQRVGCNWATNGKRLGSYSSMYQSNVYNPPASGTSLLVQWPRLGTPSAGGQSSIPGQGIRSHMQQPRVSMLKVRPSAAK